MSWGSENVRTPYDIKIQKSDNVKKDLQMFFLNGKFASKISKMLEYDKIQNLNCYKRFDTIDEKDMNEVGLDCLVYVVCCK